MSLKTLLGFHFVVQQNDIYDILQIEGVVNIVTKTHEDEFFINNNNLYSIKNASCISTKIGCLDFVTEQLKK